jgi:hypothetical protein
VRGAAHVHVLDEPHLGAVRLAELQQAIISSSLTPRMTTVSILKPGEERCGRVDAGQDAIELVVAGQALTKRSRRAYRG